ncbi:MAG: hypothetical protein AAGM67_10595, partial [Bacteroidota bacterium]
MIYQKVLRSKSSPISKRFIDWTKPLISSHSHWYKSAGLGVKIAILDSGIERENPAFSGTNSPIV